MASVKLAVRAASLGVSGFDAVGLFPNEFVASYLTLFPVDKREAMYGYLGNTPSLESVVAALGGFDGLLEVDESYNLRFGPRGCYLTEQRDFDEYISFGFVRAYQAREFQAATCRFADITVDCESVPDGYCYLRGVERKAAACLATVMGPSPTVARLQPYCRSDTVVQAAGHAAHVLPASRAEEGVQFSELPRDVCVGEELCASLWGDKLAVSLPFGKCSACSRSDAPALAPDVPRLACGKGSVPMADALQLVAGRYEVLRSASQHQVDMLWFSAGDADEPGPLHDSELGPPVRHAECLRDPGHVEPEDSDNCVRPLVVHTCAPGFSYLSLDAKYWAVELVPGERVSVGGFDFSPVAWDGGVLVGTGRAVLNYSGRRGAVAMRVFTRSAHRRFMHRRYQLGKAGPLEAIVGSSKAACVIRFGTKVSAFGSAPTGGAGTSGERACVIGPYGTVLTTCGEPLRVKLGLDVLRYSVPARVLVCGDDSQFCVTVDGGGRPGAVSAREACVPESVVIPKGITVVPNMSQEVMVFGQRVCSPGSSVNSGDACLCDSGGCPECNDMSWAEEVELRAELGCCGPEAYKSVAERDYSVYDRVQ